MNTINKRGPFPPLHQGISCICLMLLLASATCHAEIYKWVDADGQTHYSERKEDAGKAKAAGLKVAPPPTSIQAIQASDASPQYWQEQERLLKLQQAQRLNEKSYESPAVEAPKSLSGGRAGNTDVSRCNLARDIISGAVRHANGAPIDSYDRQVAENDIRAYCH